MLWHAIYGYNEGNPRVGQSPEALRALGNTGSQDADRAFKNMGFTNAQLPKLNSE
jgi:hypothetical protein